MSLGCVALTRTPPYGLFIVCLALLGFGAGTYDASLTTITSHEENAASLSFMYAFFGVRLRSLGLSCLVAEFGLTRLER
jgi:fucose permease